MTQPSLSAAPLNPESMPAVVLRRSRYVVAIVVSGILFYYLAWRLVAPPPPLEGASILLWPLQSPLAASIALAAALILSLALAMLLTHPDAPHTALYCGALGLAALAIKGGTIHLILEEANFAHTIPDLHRRLACECGIWAGLIILAELFTRILFNAFFANTSWITRHGLSADGLTRLSPILSSLLQPLPDSGSKAKSEGGLPPVLVNLIAFAFAVVLAVIFLSIFMQSQLKGQVLFACFAAFGLAVFIAHYVLPTASTWPLWLAIPATAAVGYYFASTTVYYPGHAATNLARALPMDYISAGLPGAILGYYTSVRTHLHQHFEEQAAVQ